MALVKSNKAALALIGLYRLHLFAFIILCLYFGQSLIMPIALAILLTFIFSPLVDKLELYVGKIIAVSIAFLILFLVVATTGYLLGKQLADLGSELPKYKTNIENKFNYFNLSEDNALTQIFKSIDKLESHLPGQSKVISTASPNKISKPIPVNVIQTGGSSFALIAKNFIISSLDILTFTGLVFLLLLFMLFTRKDLRGRVIRLIGPNRIGATTLAMDDAGRRITHYLLSQLLINFIYGVIVAIGLFLLGIPNAILWGGLAMILRFIPYLGVLIAAIFPIIVALAVSPTWTIPLLTLVLFIILDLVTGNIIEPLVYASNTGISSLALIISAVFWTILWGPIGLLLSTPLTVCIIVMGLHIPRLSFLNVLLSDEKGPALYEEFYQRFVAFEFTEAINLMNNFLKTHSLVELYDSAILPVLSTTEFERQNELIDDNHVAALNQNILIILDDLFYQSQLAKKEEKKDLETKNCNVLCLPASTERDEIASVMLMQTLVDASFKATALPNQFPSNELFNFIEKENFNAICISVVAPYLIIPAKKLVHKLNEKFPKIKIILGLWGAPEVGSDSEESLKSAGFDTAVFSLAQAISQLEKLCEWSSHTESSGKETNI